MSRVAIILRKEWREISKHPALIVTLVLPPLFLTILPLVVVYGMRSVDDRGVVHNLGPLKDVVAFAGLTTRELAQAVTGQQFGLLMLILPMIIPSVLAAHSIVGEKQRRTLEPLLATPVETWELLLAKSLAALIPAVLLSWACAGLFTWGIHWAALSDRVFAAIVTPGLWLVLAVCSPLLSLLTIGIMVIASSRVSDPRTAQQLSGLLFLPVAGAIVGQVTGHLVLDMPLALMFAAGLAVVDVGVLVLAVRFFDREAILTRWK